MWRYTILAVVAALALAACGGEGGGDDDVLGMGDRPLDRCDLLTVEEVEPSVGSPATAGPSDGIDGEPNPVTCRYEGPNGLLLVQARDGEVFFGAPEGGQMISDLGEEAYLESDGVDYLHDEWSVSITQIAGLPDQDALVELARLSVDRLP